MTDKSRPWDASASSVWPITAASLRAGINTVMSLKSAGSRGGAASSRSCVDHGRHGSSHVTRPAMNAGSKDRTSTMITNNPHQGRGLRKAPPSLQNKSVSTGSLLLVAVTGARRLGLDHELEPGPVLFVLIQHGRLRRHRAGGLRAEQGDAQGLERMAEGVVDGGGLKTGMHHAIGALRISAGAVPVPFGLLQQRLEAGGITLAHQQVAGFLPAEHVARRIAPRRAVIGFVAGQEIEVQARLVEAPAAAVPAGPAQ